MSTMAISPVPSSLLLGTVVFLGSLALCHEGNSEQNQPEKAGGGAGPQDGPKRLYFGVAACTECHTARPPGDMNIVLCRCNEYQKWKEEDKHSLAYEVLKGPRALQMEKLLSQAEVIKGKVAEEKSCL